MAGEERDPAVIEQIRTAVSARSADPGAIRLLGQGRALRRSGRVDAHQAEGARPGAAEAARHDATRLDGDRHRADDRHHRRHRVGGDEGHRLGLRGERLCAVGPLDAELLARHHADLPVLGAARLAAGLGLRAARPRTGGSLATTIMPAFVLGNAHRGRADAAYPQRHAAGAEQRLCAHRARQGPARARRSSSSTRCATRSPR